MMGEDAAQLAGQRYELNPDKPGYSWGTATGMVGIHGGRIAVERPRVRDKATGRELPLPNCTWRKSF